MWNVTVFVYCLSFCFGINSSPSSPSAIFPSSDVTHSSSPVCIPQQQRRCRHQPKDWFMMPPPYTTVSVEPTDALPYDGDGDADADAFISDRSRKLHCTELQRCLEKCSLCGPYCATWSIKELSYWKSIWFRKQWRYRHVTETCS